MYRTVRGLRGFVGQGRPKFPYGLGGLVGQRKPSFPYGLGCECKKALGQDDTALMDYGSLPPLSTVIDDSNANPYGYSAPVAQAGSSPIYSVFNNPASSPLSFGTTPTTAATAVASTSSMASYLPYIALALGGVVLISAVKKR